MQTSSVDLFHEKLFNWPNAITVVRVIVGLFVFGLAASSTNSLWSFAGLGLHWVLDGLDGYLARSLKQETRFGAQIDIIADRAMVSFFYIIYLRAHPSFLVPIVGYLVVYGFIDQYLSNQYANWGLLSPNYFYQVNRRIWLLNWSTPGKFVNSGMFTILLLGTGSVTASTVWLVGLAVLKLYSFIKIHRLPLPDAWRSVWQSPPESDGAVRELARPVR